MSFGLYIVCGQSVTSCCLVLQCKHDFCWVCLEPWKKHSTATGGYFRCNRYEVVKKVEEHQDMLKSEVCRFKQKILVAIICQYINNWIWAKFHSWFCLDGKTENVIKYQLAQNWPVLTYIYMLILGRGKEQENAGIEQICSLLLKIQKPWKQLQSKSFSC